MLPSHLAIFTLRARLVGTQNGGILLSSSKRRCLTFSSAASAVQGSNNRNRCLHKCTPRVGQSPSSIPIPPIEAASDKYSGVRNQRNPRLMRSWARAKAEAESARVRG